MKASRTWMVFAAFLISQLSTVAQEYSFVIESNYGLDNSYPSNANWEEDGRTADMLKRGDTVIVYAYDKKLNIVSIYNQRQMGNMYLLGEKSLIKQIKKAKVLNLSWKTTGWKVHLLSI